MGVNLGRFTERDEEIQRQLDDDAAILAGNKSLDDPYDRLPLPIKMRYTRAEYLWLTDEQKLTLEQRECDPEF